MKRCVFDPKKYQVVWYLPIFVHVSLCCEEVYAWTVMQSIHIYIYMGKWYRKFYIISPYTYTTVIFLGTPHSPVSSNATGKVWFTVVRCLTSSAANRCRSTKDHGLYLWDLFGMATYVWIVQGLWSKKVISVCVVIGGSRWLLYPWPRVLLKSGRKLFRRELG